MLTATAPANVRDQAYAIIRARLPDRVAVGRDPLLGAGATVVGELLLDLERAFGIDLDYEPQVLWAASTANDLVNLVESLVGVRRKLTALLASNDDMPLQDRARARRARGERLPVYMPEPQDIDRHLTWRETLRIITVLAIIGAASGIAGALAVGIAYLFGVR